MKHYEYLFPERRATTAKPVIYKVNDYGCWICTSHFHNKNGYYPFQYQNKKTLLHRLTYCLHNNLDIHTFPTETVCRHKCDNPSCINPEHIELGTQVENLNDAKIRGRLNPAKGEKSGVSKFSDETVLEIFNHPGTQNEIAEKYGVSKRTISRIKSKTTRTYLWEE